MKLSAEEIENLNQLLFSPDENNILLALELISQYKVIETFAAELVFMLVMEDDGMEVNAVLHQLTAELPDDCLKYWVEKTEVLSEVMTSTKADFLKFLKEYETEKTVFETFMKGAPRYAHIYRAIGRRLLKNLNKKKAGYYYLKKALEIDPDFKELHFDYAYFLKENKKRADEIIYHYKRCIELGADSFEPYHNLARIYELKGETETCLQTFREGLRLFPNSVEMMTEMASVLDDMGKYEQSKNLLETAIEKNPAYGLAFNNLSFLYLTVFKDYENARKHIERAHSLSPNKALYLHTMAELEWLGYGNRKKALELLYLAKEREPNYTDADGMIKELEELGTR
jgi:tetratricopeptide (TPR) repeat protein